MTATSTDTPAGKPVRITFLEGLGGLPMLEISTLWGTAGIYLHGAHVTHFARHGEPPLLFLSQCSRFEEGHPIRGGIPIIFPWFGPQAAGQHGFARVKGWALQEIIQNQDGSVVLRFRLPECPEAAHLPPFTLEYVVTIRDSLTLRLHTINRSETQALAFENCLHTYFNVGDIGATWIRGLKGATYLDRLDNQARKVEDEEAIRIASEVDRTYVDTVSAVEIGDERNRRRIIVSKTGMNSTVVWNPWIAKSKAMQDFCDDEYERMVCVESGNVAANALKIPPGGSSASTVKIESQPLA